jgi:hypothetical protein
MVLTCWGLAWGSHQSEVILDSLLSDQGFWFFKKFRINEPLVWVFVRKNQNYRITGSGYFRNMKELAVSMKESAKNR